MAVDLIVQRNGGFNPGPDIEDPLIGNESVAVQRGRNELDRTFSVKENVTYTTVFRPGVRLGQLVEINDSLFGEVFRAKVIDIQHTISQTEAVTRLVIERESRFIS